MAAFMGGGLEGVKETGRATKGSCFTWAVEDEGTKPVLRLPQWDWLWGQHVEILVSLCLS